MDNVIISYGEKEFRGSDLGNTRGSYSGFMRKPYQSAQIQDDEAQIPLRTGLGLNDRSIVKISFKAKPRLLV